MRVDIVKPQKIVFFFTMVHRVFGLVSGLQEAVYLFPRRESCEIALSCNRYGAHSPFPGTSRLYRFSRKVDNIEHQKLFSSSPLLTVIVPAASRRERCLPLAEGAR